MIIVAIVEDIREIREGLRLLIDNSDGFVCVQTYQTAEDALMALPLDPPDVVLMDIHLPGMNGIEAVRRLKGLCPRTQFLISTVYEDDTNLFESLKAGASGYLLKKTAPANLLEAITEVYRGGSPMNSQIARKVIASFQEKPTPDELTAREREVLQALSRGLRYKEIATDMAISAETVRTHVRHIYEKLQVQSRTEALNKVYGRR
jgi:DNA-binding NarL/FixJ family response regulator